MEEVFTRLPNPKLAKRPDQGTKVKTETTRGCCARTNYLHLLRSGLFSDAVVQVLGVQYRIHRNIMACCSEYFKALFMNKLRLCQGDGKEMTTHVLEGSNQYRENKGNVKSSKIRFTTSRRSSDVTKKPGTEVRQNKISKLTPFALAECNNRVSSNEIDEKKSRHLVTISDVNPAIMYQILIFAYGGQVHLGQENVEQLLMVADRFQITPLVLECCEFLAGHMTIDNCISIYKFVSNFYECNRLTELAFLYALDNFESVYQKSTDFCQLTPAELCRLLVDDRLNVRREETLLDAIAVWIMADSQTRQAFVPSLVNCIRVGSFMPGYVADSLFSTRPSTNHSNSSKEMVLKIMSAVMEKHSHRIDTFEPRLPSDVLFIIGGSNFGYPLELIEVFDSRTWSWSNIGPYDFAPRSYHGVVCLDHELYVIGGFDGHSYLSSCCKFSPNRDAICVENVNPMNTKRCYVGVAQVKQCIYAMGGYDGVYRLNSAERFDLKTNQWTFLNPMTHQRSDAGVAALDDKIYVCGGFSGSDCIRTVEMYDPETEEWTLQTPMPQGRSGLGVVAHKDCLYAVGGFNGVDSSVRLSLMESYNPLTKQWTSLKPMPHPRSNLAVAVMEDTLYAIGGYNGDRTCGVVECYHFETDSWYQSSRLSQSRSALSVCVVSGLSNRAAILGRDTDNVSEGLGDCDEEDGQPGVSSLTK